MAASARPTGATATMHGREPPVVTSATGARIEISSHVSKPGFNPLDLLYASLAACLVLSARMAAQRLGVLDRIEDIDARVTGTKAAEGPSRVERFHVEMSIVGDIDQAIKDSIAEAAETEICTVSNTLRGRPVIEAGKG